MRMPSFSRCMRSRGARLRRSRALRQRFGTHQLQALGRVVAVDLLHIELAHEVDRFLRDDLPGHHDREAGRIRNDEVGRDQIGTVLQAAVDLRIGQPDVFAAGRVVGGIEAAADVAFVGLLAGVPPEGSRGSARSSADPARPSSGS